MGIFKGRLGGPQKTILFAIVGCILGFLIVFGSNGGCDAVLAHNYDKPNCPNYDPLCTVVKPR